MDLKKKPKEFDTCWTCILGEYMKALKESDDVECNCKKDDYRKIHVQRVGAIGWIADIKK